MDNYLSTFNHKIAHIFQMVSVYGKCSVASDFFHIARVKKEGEKVKEGRTHGYGTVYETVSLADVYEKELNDFLRKNNISMRANKKEIFFVSKALLKTTK